MTENRAPVAHVVVVSDEDRYSIWPADRAIPEGWRREGTAGSEQECLDRIELIWPDIRPLALRREGGQESAWR